MDVLEAMSRTGLVWRYGNDDHFSIFLPSYVQLKLLTDLPNFPDLVG